MRWLAVIAPVVVGACASPAATDGKEGAVALDLERPHGALDPSGFTSVDVVLHEPAAQDVELTAQVKDNAFSLGTIARGAGVTVEATLRNDSGAAVGYGRTAVTTTIGPTGATISVPVRRPIIYIAGAVNRDTGNTVPSPQLWSEAPATFSDLTTGAALDGTSVLAAPSALMVSAGPNLYAITQAIDSATGDLTGAAQVVPVSTADHTMQAALPAMITGAVLDAAGSDDGKQLVIGTTTQLVAVDTTTGQATPLATGSFARVAVLIAASGEVDAIAVQNRGATTGACATTAELWWAPITASGGAKMLATGGFSDVAADRGQAYYVDACTRALGTADATGPHMLRQLATTGSAAAETTALAVSNGQAYVGIEDPPATTSLIVASVTSADTPRVLWTETAQQVVQATGLDGVQRLLDATGITIGHLELGAGSDYVALSTSAHFHGAPVAQANFPDITMDSEELRVFDAATGGAVQRYRSWCEGVITFQQNTNDISDWKCAAIPGQTTPVSGADHHIGSMSFLYGKK
jgi:hypothetical protein